MSWYLDSSNTTNGLNHGPVWKIQSFLLSGICMVILWQDYCGKGNLRTSYCSTVFKGFRLGVPLCTPSKGLFFSVYVDDINWLERIKTLIRCGNYWPKKSIWENQHLPLIMYTWDALKDNVKSAKILDSDRTMFESRISAGETEMLPFLIFLFLHGLMIWRVMQRNVSSDIVS